MELDTQYILEKIFIATNVPIFIFDDKNQLSTMIGIENDSNFNYSQDFSLYMAFLKRLEKDSTPFVEVKENIFVYFGFLDEKNNKYIIGPHILEGDLQRQLYLEENRPNSTISRILYKRCEKLLNDFYLYYSCITKKKISSADIIGVDKLIIAENGNIEQEINHYRLQKNDQDLRHLTYEFENNYMLAIEYGRADNIRTMSSMNQDLTDRVGQMATNNLKQVEYTIASSIVLVSRAAIRGGVNPSEAYEMAELFFKRLEKCRTKMEMFKINESMKNQFSEMVKTVRSRTKMRGYVEQCKDYITQNIYSPLRVEEIAKIIGINSNYLSRKFTEEEGSTISQYIIQARLKAARDLIKHSKMGISEISEYLCFSSQSHFGKLFKKEFGMSPLQYKKQYMVVEIKE